MARHTWRDGEAVQCGANLVRIAALNGGRALVIGGGLFGPWSIWVDASQLQRAEQPDHDAPQATRRMKLARDAVEPGRLPFLEQVSSGSHPVRSRPRGKPMDPLTPMPKINVEKPIPATKKKERSARESDWENEAGSVKDEKGAAGANY